MRRCRHRVRFAGAAAAEKQPAPRQVGRRQLCIARGKDPVLGCVIAQSSYQLIGFPGVISLMSRRNWCMRSTSRKKRSVMAAILFHDFTIDDSDLSCLLLSTSARIFSVVQ